MEVSPLRTQKDHPRLTPIPQILLISIESDPL